MYESSFGISGPAFQLSPDPTFYFDSRGHHRALLQLRRGLSGDDPGIVVVSGEIGAGKTTLIRTLLKELDPDLFVVSHVVSTQLDAHELLVAVSIGLGLPIVAPAQLVPQLLRLLVHLEKNGRQALLVIDEAQNLHRDAFDQLLALATRRAPRRLPLQICLLGQPELRSMIDAADLAALRKLVTASCHLGPIDRAETRAYVEHRLSVVGWTGTPHFEADAFDEIYRWTQGIPRRINSLCNRLMLSRYLASETRVDVESVVQAARDQRSEIGEPGVEPPALPASQPTEDATLVLTASAMQMPRVAAMPSASLLCVVASPGDHIKAAALMRALAARSELPPVRLVRVHDDDALALSRELFAGLDVDTGLINLGLAEPRAPTDGHNAKMAGFFDSVLLRARPRAIVVFDGSPTALCCASVAHKRAVPIVHIGAGLRPSGADGPTSTRVATDQLADLLYTTDADASRTLMQEGFPAERVHCVGTLLVDAMQYTLQSMPSSARGSAGAEALLTHVRRRGGYALVVLGEPANIGERPALQRLLTTLQEVSRDLPLVWPMSRRVQDQLRRLRLDGFVSEDRTVRLPAQPYAGYLELLGGSTCVLTDSWNVQEEATALGVPCLTIGAYPERAITTAIGTNVAVGLDRALLTRTLWQCMFSGGKRGGVPSMWDGRAGARIAGYLAAWLPEESVTEPASRPRA